MIDSLFLAVGAALVTLGWLVGYLTGRRAARRRHDAPQQPICGCSHHRAVHDPKTGECRASVKQGRWDKYGNHTGYNHVACACQGYVGPEPIQSVWVPPAAVESDR